MLLGVVVVVVKPLIAYASPSVETLEGRDVKLMCVVLLGNPTPVITWYKMGERLTNRDDVASGNNGNGGHLSLNDVTTADEGEYTCVASNAGGNATQTTQLDVHGMHCQSHHLAGLLLENVLRLLGTLCRTLSNAAHTVYLLSDVI